MARAGRTHRVSCRLETVIPALSGITWALGPFMASSAKGVQAVYLLPSQRRRIVGPMVRLCRRARKAFLAGRVRGKHSLPDGLPERASEIGSVGREPKMAQVVSPILIGIVQVRPTVPLFH